MAKKLYNFADSNLDSQIREICTNTFSGLLVYANNTAAKAAGLKVGHPYMTSTGQVMVVY